MKAAAALGFTLVLGFLASQALGATPGIGLPTTSVTLSVPSVPPVPTLPTPPPTTVPTVPTLPVKPPAPTPTVSIPTTTTVRTPVTSTSVGVPQASLPSPVTASSPTSGATSSGAGAPHTAAVSGTAATTGGGFGLAPSAVGSPAGSSSAGVQHLRSSRNYVAVRGKKARRILLTFFLAHASRVYFVVTQLSPGCHIVGRFSIRGQQGLNHVPFYGRIGKRKLQPGTYRIAAHTRRRPTLARITLVVVDRAPTLAQLRTAQAANVCPADSAATALIDGNQTPSAGSVAKSHNANAVPGGPKVGSGAGAVLGSDIAKVARSLQPLLVALLGIAIMLLGVASLPQPATQMNRISEGLARHRVGLAGLGAAALVGAAIAFLLG